MRYNKLILPIVLALFVLPRPAAGNTAAAAGQPDAQGFRILLSDGSILKGAVSFTMNIDTQYGRLTVPSTNLVSARFNSTDGWADIRTKGIQLRVQYKPASSDLKATTDVGPVNVDLTRGVSVETLYAELPTAAPPPASNPYNEGSLVPAPPSDIYSQPATVIDTTPYQYAAPAPYYWPSYYPPEPYSYAYYYPFFWWPRFGFTVIGDFDFDRDRDRDHHRHHDGFDGRFHGHDSGVAWNGSGARHSAAASVRRFNGTAGLSPAVSGRTFSSPSFRSAAAPSFRSGAAPTFRSGGTTTFRSAPAPSFRSGGMQFSHAGGFAQGGGRGR